jgi:hypothetical protein
MPLISVASLHVERGKMPGGKMASTTRLTPESLKQELSTYEESYGISSADFIEKYQAGEMGDSRDVMRWAWLCSVALKLGVLVVQEPKRSITA